jgi:tripartite-type tricarboxylate transporter receptor subunit TctC
VPADVLERLHRAAVAALASDDLKKQYATFNATPAPSTPQQYAAFVLAEQAKWGPVVVKTGVKLE